MVKVKQKKVKDNLKNRIFDIINILLLTTATILVLYPLYFIIIASFSDPVAVQSGEVFLFPKGFTLEGYETILKTKSIIYGYANSLFCVFAGTAINLFFTIPAGYALSKKDLPFKKAIMLFFVFTMFFNGGMIPTYLLVKDFGLLNSLWALVLTDCVSVMNLIIVRTFFSSNVPEEIYEAAKIDGCSEIGAFIKVALPLAKPIIAIMILYYGVGHWNQFFKGIIYIQNEEHYPLQVILRNILVQNTANTTMSFTADTAVAQQKLAELIKYGTIIVGSLPPLIMYPFVQKYFEKGVMVGSVKG